VHIKALGELRQGLLALDGRQCYLCFEGRWVRRRDRFIWLAPIHAARAANQSRFFTSPAVQFLGTTFLTRRRVAVRAAYRGLLSTLFDPQQGKLDNPSMR